MNKNKLVGDLALNLVSSVMPIALLQLLILPALGRAVGDSTYGLIVTLIGIFNYLSQVLGSSLNNTRLLLDGKYTSKGFLGDFNPLFLISLAASMCAAFIAAFFYGDGGFITPALVALISGMMSAELYYPVAFRLILNYKKMFFEKLCLSVGLISGFFLYRLIGRWELIYICGYGFALIFSAFAGALMREPLVLTPLFRETLSHNAALVTSSALGYALVYIDRLLLYPLLGGAAVSVYYSATIFGKMISLLISPLTNVMLSYLVKIERMRCASFFILIGISAIVGIVGYTVAVLISPFLLGLLYPDWAVESLKLIHITTATAIVSMLCTIVNPLILRFCNIKWQIVINIINVAIYITLTMTLMSAYGFIGFCIGSLLTMCVKFMILFVIAFIALRRINKTA